MRKSLIAAIVVLALLAISVPVLTALLPENRIENITKYQHEVNAEANPQIGSSTLPDDFILDDTFVTHLPIVVIDLKGNTIPNIYKWTADGKGREYTEEGLKNPNPWAEMTITIIDNDNNENRLSDKPELVNNGKIKLRGMTSRGYDKKQYGIKLMNGAEELETSIMGMDSDEDWVLSNSIIDMSGIRNYLALNIGRQIMPFTSEVRFCEVVFKDGDTYTYQGLYLMLEKVKKAEGAINIDDYNEKAASLNYVVCRDRYDKTRLTLSTWASDQQLCYGYFTMEYPQEELLSPAAIERIQAELSKIETVLYSDDPKEFLKYRNYLDVDSFVDYFIINEFFLNYDAGNNSTYYYKTHEGKLAIGPLWDYDGAIDNYHLGMADLEHSSFANQPWFEKLITDEYFQNKVFERYEELRNTVLNEDYINDFIDDSFEYLGNARLRDYQRWETSFDEKHRLPSGENSEGFLINRDYGDPEGDKDRIKDLLSIHGNWMDEHLKESIAYRVNEDIVEESEFDPTGIAVIGILAFAAMIIVLLRYVKGEYR